MHLRSLLVSLLVITSSSAYAQDAKKTAEDFATKWVTACDAGDATTLAGPFTQDGVFNAWGARSVWVPECEVVAKNMTIRLAAYDGTNWPGTWQNLSTASTLAAAITHPSYGIWEIGDASPSNANPQDGG